MDLSSAEAEDSEQGVGSLAKDLLVVEDNSSLLEPLKAEAK